MKKILKATLFLVLLSVSVNIFAADLEKIEVIDNWNISVWTTTDLILPKAELKWDLKVLKDYVVSFAVKDPENPKKILLNLTYELEKGREYTIIWIDWAEANMTFSTLDKVSGEYINSDIKTEWLKIEKINILDNKTVEIYYNEELKAEEFIFRFLSNLPVKSMFWVNDNKLNIVLEKPLENLTPYIIISNSLDDKDGKSVKLQETIYEFETQDNLINFFPDIDLNAAKEIENEIAVKDEWNVEEVAMEAKKTPDTWAATWILILMTLIIVWIVSIKFKKS